jgi:ABC-2 type transport system ATP-binding protein
VLDEPTTGLDPAQRADLRRTLSALGHRSTVLLSTHQTEDVAALCSQVVVMDRGRSLFAGSVPALVATADGRVWVDDRRDDRAVAAYRQGDGSYRHVGEPPSGADLLAPTIEDAYLLMVGPSDDDQRSAA